jgi:hypothetical protein
VPLPTNAILVKQPQFIVKPAPTPPLPAEAPSFPGPHEMSPHLLLHPVFDKVEASTGVTNGKVVHPAAQRRVDELNYPLSENMRADQQFDEHAPLSRWSALGTTQTAAECHAARGRLRHDPQPPIRLIGRVSDCIASDYPGACRLCLEKPAAPSDTSPQARARGGASCSSFYQWLPQRAKGDALTRAIACNQNKYGEQSKSSPSLEIALDSAK